MRVKDYQLRSLTLFKAILRLQMPVLKERSA